MALRNDWAWQPDGDTLAALARGAQKMRRAGSRSSGSIINEETKVATKKATKKVEPKAKAKGKKLDGKALADKRKPRDSVAQFIKDELLAGKSDVAKIVERAKAEFPKTNPTNGYVRFIAKQIGKEKQVASEPKAKPAKAAAKKGAAPKKAAKKDKAPKADAPAEPKADKQEPDPAS